MKQEMLKRLDDIENSLTTDKNGILFFQSVDESDDECADRIARWKAGEKVEGQNRQYAGKDQMIMVIKFIETHRKEEEAIE